MEFVPAPHSVGPIVVLDAKRITYLQAFVKAALFVLGSNWDVSRHSDAAFGGRTILRTHKLAGHSIWS